MSRIFYKIRFAEEYYDSEEMRELLRPLKRVEYDLPHARELAEWIAKEWNAAHIENTFDGELKGKVALCRMKPMHVNEKDGHTYTEGIVTIEFVKGFRLSERRRKMCWDSLDGQMTDGFGESFDGQQIPGAPDGWCVQF